MYIRKYHSINNSIYIFISCIKYSHIDFKNYIIKNTLDINRYLTVTDHM